MKYLLIMMLVACAIPPKDISVPELNNHMRIEMEVDGVTTVGMAGISYQSRSDIKNSKLVFYPVYKGVLEMWSDRCGQTFSVPYDKNEILSVNIVDLLPKNFDTTCTYKIRRIVNGADNNMIGQFGINYFSRYNPLKIEVAGKMFTGIAHMQVRESELIPTVAEIIEQTEVTIPLLLSIDESKLIKVYPTSKRGQIIFKGGSGCSTAYPPIDYDFTADGSPQYKLIDLALIFSEFGVDDSCDYEILATAYDAPKMEECMFMLNVYKKDTMWLEPPILSKNSIGQLETTFINPFVMGISINSKICENTNHCATKCKDDQVCTVRAITRSGRFFYGKVLNKKFIEIQ